MADYPTLPVMFDDAGWACTEDGLWLKADPNLTLYTDGEGWLYLPKEPGMVSTWSWPEVWEEPTWGDYVARHPTRYNWLPDRPDVEAIARWIVDTYGDYVWVSTYYDHPEGYGRDADSFDIWGAGGRGDPVPMDVCDEIVGILVNDPNPPDIEWYIWRRYIYGAWNDWQGEFFGDGSKFTNHDDHGHITYRRLGG